ncbi:MAG: hypothetical protein IPK22_24175 [Verrucomicrobiaceae bacterium]|nr:hypothetical protein [Verrucomicrobiaceae bacterium]
MNRTFSISRTRQIALFAFCVWPFIWSAGFILPQGTPRTCWFMTLVLTMGFWIVLAEDSQLRTKHPRMALGARCIVYAQLLLIIATYLRHKSIL